MLHKYLNIQNMHEDFFFFSLGPWQEGVRGPCDRQVIAISSGKLHLHTTAITVSVNSSRMKIFILLTWKL